jgi:clan AA aspartic protease (TIGR02281 family)
MTSWEFVIVVGCAAAAFLLVSFILEVLGSKGKPTADQNSRTGYEPVEGANAMLSPPRKLLGGGFALALLLLVGYAVAPSDLWNLVAGKHLFSSSLAQTAEIARNRDGSFSIIAQVNGSRIAFVIDTGASAVILTQDAAKAARLPLDHLTYLVDIETANGPTHAAAVTLDWLTVGGITERSVSALVAQPGHLNTSLLGMSFLNRLESWEVHGDRLTMRSFP